LPLDIGRPFNTSSTLADQLEITSESQFYPFQGGNLGVVARCQLTRDELLQRIKHRLGIARVQTIWHTDQIDPIAVIAGGGDAEKFVVAASEAGCRTYLNGIVHNHVDHPEVQRDNEAFRAAAEKFKMNLIGVSHYASEEPAIHRTLELLHEAFELPVHFFPDEDKICSINKSW
jgi:putative NIF3 family GTP cyclohydrolase 1 type 2